MGQLLKKSAMIPFSKELFMNTNIACCIGLLAMFFQALNADWRPASGPWGGSISCFAMGSGAIVAGSMDDGVFRSTDGGTNWTPVDSGIPVSLGGWRPVTALAAHGNVFFAGTPESGILRSTDNGASWTAVNSGITRTDGVWALLAGDSGIFAGVGSRIYRSIDDGEHWTPAGGSYADAGCVIANGNSLFLGTPANGVWLSTNNGETWTPVDSGLPYKSVIALVAGNVAVFASTDSGVFRSNDNGTSWTAVNSGLTGTAIYGRYYPLLMSGGSLFAATDSSVFRTTDQGANWTAINSGLSQFGVMSLAASGNTLFAGTISGGIFRSTDNGSNWAPVNSGLRSTKSIRTLSVAGDNLLAGYPESPGWGSGIFTSADNGLHWNDIASRFTNDPEASYLIFDLSQGGAVLAETEYRYPLPPSYSLSTTGGASWTQVESGLNGQLYSFTSIPNTLLIGTEDGIICSTDSGVTWSEPDSSIRGKPIYSLLWKSGRMIAGSKGGVFVSSDSAVSWKKAPFGLMSMRVEALATCGDAYFAASSYDDVFRSTDNGETWNAVNSGLTNTSVFALVSQDSTLFAGTLGGGVFLSTDKGASWDPFNSGLPAVNVYSLAVNGDDLFAGTEGYGVWQRPLSETGVISDRPQQTNVVRQTGFNFLAPSPANPCFRVTFSLAHPDRVVITLYSLSGRAVASIFNKCVGAGTYSIKWDARAVARGCYVVKMHPGGKNSARIVRFDR